jgi:prepilin-type N-terminal cleavage/methylation domain-containing protein
MSTIGNKKGFTLIEVMVAVAVLSFGLVLVYQAFFIAFDSFNYSADYLAISCWMDEKVWEAQDNIMRTGSLQDYQLQGEFLARNKLFNWQVSSNLLDQSANLSAVNLQVNWKEAKRNVKASRFFYAKYNEK